MTLNQDSVNEDFLMEVWKGRPFSLFPCMVITVELDGMD